MLFSQTEFIFLFLPACVLCYQIALRFSRDAGLSVLVLFSLYFYAYFEYHLLVLLFFSLFLNYGVYRYFIRRDYKKRTGLIAGIVANLLILGYFKYSGFLFYDVFHVDALGMSFQAPILPLGISFVTFHQISFLVGQAEEKGPPVSFLDYMVYITFFPHLVAGPIVRQEQLIPQLRHATVTAEGFATGVFIFSLGLAKKLLIADGLGQWANRAFDGQGILTTTDAWLGTLAYTFQLYFDFSGYSDMAIGLALLFGFTFPINFNSPYKATSIQDFWRRWHITLSDFIRDYIYIRLGGNRNGPARTYFNLVITMVLGGIWHGAGFTFILWGLMHGLGLAANRLWNRMGFAMGNLTGWFLTFLFVIHAWVLFRARDLGDAMRMFRGMYDGLVLDPAAAEVAGTTMKALGIAIGTIATAPSVLPLHGWVVVAAVMGIALAAPNTLELARRSREGSAVRQLVYFAFAGMLLALSIKRMMEASAPNEFIYFQF